MAALKPTILPGVPRLFSRMFDKVMQTKDKKGGISKFLFDLGYNSKKSLLDEGSYLSYLYPELPQTKTFLWTLT